MTTLLALVISKFFHKVSNYRGIIYIQSRKETNLPSPLFLKTLGSAFPHPELGVRK